MANYKISGGKKLRGTVETKSAKNSAISSMCAALLTTDTVVIKDVPRIQDVYLMEKVLKSIGISIHWKNGEMSLRAPKKLNLESIDVESASKLRAVLFLIGALAHRYTTYRVPRAGGCKLGKRTVSSHLFGFEKLGLNIKADTKFYNMKKTGRRLAGTKIVMYETGDTSTENLILASVLAKGKTIIKLASANYMVQDLCHFLNAMGAKISNIGLPTLIIEGVEKLYGAKYHLIPDPIESMFWISLAATTKSSLRINSCPEEFLELELLKLEKMGFRYKIIRRYLSKSKNFSLIDIQTYPSRLVALEDKIDERPFPGLNIDNLPFFVPIATQAHGNTIIHDWCYENRTIYFMEFQRLGATVHMADQHRVLITGPTPLQPNEIVCPPALRPATIIIIGMLAAKGTSVFYNSYSIDRGYEDLCGRLRKIGADIREM